MSLQYKITRHSAPSEYKLQRRLNREFSVSNPKEEEFGRHRFCVFWMLNPDAVTLQDSGVLWSPEHTGPRRIWTVSTHGGLTL